ncbi:ATPase [Corynebacterium alimapuense]|uniref:ATPase n=2 Tax=Corynebacterium alimapuense TaxID=1576874 RepID=A0A3M8K7S4_9CORY|nr:potassium transporter TrkG [Corynebacterium alimapuense]RNE49281.1 ATPase [Corynebacterium alimapuense]
MGIIGIGTAILMSPWSSADGRITPLADAFFTATSATSLTGLITLDTAVHWSWLGLVTILLLIQIGGLGFMTLASLLGLILAGRLGLRSRLGATAEGRGADLGDVVWVIRATVLFTLAVETLVAVFLAIRFHGNYGYSWGRAIWEGIFHAISGFNNAGFALYSDNVVGFASDAGILLPLAFALMIGGIGFPVLLEATRRAKRKMSGKPVRRWSLTARFTFIGTVVLVVAGTALVALVEWNRALVHVGSATDSQDESSAGVRLLNAFFSGVSPRTAGFNSVDYVDFHPATWMGTDLLMFIGGGSGGTAGGLKITTAIVLVAAVAAEIRGDSSVAVFGRTIRSSVVRQALVILTGSVALILGATMTILLLAPDLKADQVLFEVISAFSTVGLSTGITAELPELAQILIAVLMFAGRIGPLALATAVAARAHGRKFDYPEERPFIG